MLSPTTAVSTHIYDVERSEILLLKCSIFKLVRSRAGKLEVTGESFVNPQQSRHTKVSPRTLSTAASLLCC